MDGFGLNFGTHVIMLPELMHGKFSERLFIAVMNLKCLLKSLIS